MLVARLHFRNKTALLLASSLLLWAGCKHGNAHANGSDAGYHVTEYDGLRKQWTVVYKIFDPKQRTYHRRRYLLRCDSYEYNNKGFEHGPNVCVLKVGDVLNPDEEHPGHHVYIDQSGRDPGTNEQLFYIKSDDGETSEAQFFQIVKEEILVDEK